MATRTLEIDVRQGTGASSEPMYGVVTVQRVKAKSAGGFEILPFETTLKLINGKAKITEAETDGTGPIYDSAYLFRVQNGYCAPRWGFMAALPDGSTPITTGELPMVDPITGEGIYMDAQEWNDLYGDLPDRVSATETRLGVLDGLGQRGYTVDQTAGRTVTVWDYLNNREQLIYGDTGWRDVSADLLNGWSGSVLLRRCGNNVQLIFEPLIGSSATGSRALLLSQGGGFAAGINQRFDLWTTTPSAVRGILYAASVEFFNSSNVGTVYGTINFMTSDPWPTSLPGVAA